MALRHSLFEVDIGPVRRSEPRIDSSCCFSTAQESDSRSNVSLATQFFQQPARPRMPAARAIPKANFCFCPSSTIGASPLREKALPQDTVSKKFQEQLSL